MSVRELIEACTHLVPANDLERAWVRRIIDTRLEHGYEVAAALLDDPQMPGPVRKWFAQDVLASVGVGERDMVLRRSLQYGTCSRCGGGTVPWECLRCGADFGYSAAEIEEMRGDVLAAGISVSLPVERKA